MTREIKFRGKRVTDNTWIYGYYYCIGRDGNQKHYILPEYEVAPYGREVIPETVGQYMEKHDYNKQKIYEGDICRLVWSRNTVVTAQISFECGSFWFQGLDLNVCDCNWHFYPRRNIEVIGNIHDNPELLKEST